MEREWEHSILSSIASYALRQAHRNGCGFQAYLRERRMRTHDVSEDIKIGIPKNLS
jgi:hypothetical protein